MVFLAKSSVLLANEQTLLEDVKEHQAMIIQGMLTVRVLSLWGRLRFGYLSARMISACNK